MSLEDAVSFLQQHVFPCIGEDHIGLLSDTVRENVRFKAHPTYGRNGAANQNWATLNYGKGHEIPAHLLCYFHLPTKPKKPIKLPGLRFAIKECGFFAFVHTLPCSLNRREVGDKQEIADCNQELIFRCQKWDAGRHGDYPEYNEVLPGAVQPTLQMVSCDIIQLPCIAIPDFYAKSNNSHVFYVLLPHAMWGPRFIEFAKESFDAEVKELTSKDTSGPLKRRKTKEELKSDAEKLAKLKRSRNLYGCRPHRDEL